MPAMTKQQAESVTQAAVKDVLEGRSEEALIKVKNLVRSGVSNRRVRAILDAGLVARHRNTNS